MKYIMILQARMSSERLPAKVILPLAGIPMSVLCAKRCVIQNVDFVLATSNDATDDVLVSLFKNNNIQKVNLKIEKTQIIKNTSSVGVESTKERL